MGLRIELLDQYGTQQASINGVRVGGPARGYRKLRFNPVGSSVDQIGTCSFELPMALRANYALAIGTMARVVDTTYGVQGTYVVGDKSEGISADGHWVTFTLADLMEELRWGEVPGFVAQDKSFETTVQTTQRLLDIANLAQPAHPWHAVLVGTDPFAGTPFQIEGTTPFQSIGKLAQDRFMHFRRNPHYGDERYIEIGTFPANPTGIRLVRSSARPAGMNNVAIRPIPEGGMTVKQDAAAIINCIAPTGAGAGFAQLTLQPLWNAANVATDPGNSYQYSTPIAFSGLDSAYPTIYRRIRYDGGGLDGYEYFLMDATSIATYRQRWLRYQRTDIGSVSSAPLDLAAAAQALYVTAIAYLKGHSKPNQVLTVRTIGRGNVTVLAGATVQVEYAFTENTVRTLNINGPYIVLGLDRSVADADGTLSDTWQVSSLGQYAATNATVISGMSQAIDSLRLGGTMYPSRGAGIYIDSPIDSGHPVTATVDVDAGVIAIVQAIFNVSLLPLISPVNGGYIVPHTHTATVPSVRVDATVPYMYEQSSNPGTQFTHAHTTRNPGGQANFGHGAPANQFSHGHTSRNPGNQANYGHSAPGGQHSHGHTRYNPGNQANYGHSAPGGQHSHGHTRYNPGAQAAYGHSAGGGQGGHTQGVDPSATGHGHGHNISANKNGTSANNTDVAHVHYIQVGSSGGSPVNQTLHYIAQGDNSFLEVQGGSGGSLHTNGYYGTGGAGSNHAHSDSIGINNGGNVYGVGNFGGSSNSYGGFTPGIDGHGGFTPTIYGDDPGGFAPGIDQHGGFTPTVFGDDPGGFAPGIDQHGGFTPTVYGDDPGGFAPGIDQHGGFTPTVYGDDPGGFAPGVDQHGGFTPNIGNDDPYGFTPGVNQHGGFTPNIGNDDPYGFTPDSRFPGYNNLQTQPASIVTSTTQSDSTVKPQYGIYTDPYGSPSNVTIAINGAQVAGPFSASFVADLTANIAPLVAAGNPVNVIFTSATLGRIIVRGKTRLRESVVRIG